MAQSDTARLQPAITRRGAQQFPTLDHVWLGAAIALIALRSLLTPIPPHDFWWHMATGRMIVQSGTIPTVDQFSFTQAGQPFYNQSWLAQLIMYGLYRLGGIPLLLLMQALVLVVAYGLLLRLCIKRSGALRLSVGLLLMTTIPMSFDNWNVRPQTYAFPLFVAFLYILTGWRIGTGSQPATTARNYHAQLFRGRLWLLPLLMIVWVNLHGSFVLGGGLIALTSGGEWLRRVVADRSEAAAWATRPIGKPEDVLQRLERPQRPPLFPLFFWGGVTAMVLLINPRGIQVLEYVTKLLSTSAVTNLVTEWAPPTIRDPGSVIFFLFVMVSVVILAYAQRRPDPVDMLLAAVFFWLALGAVRNIVWFGIVMTPLLSVQAAAWIWPTGKPLSIRHSSADVPAINALLLGLLALMLLLALPWVKPMLNLPPEVGALIDPETPVAAVEFLRTEPQRPQHLFHTLGTGSYIIWALPDQPVFIDPRIELYPLAQWRDYIHLNAGENVDLLLAKYDIDGLLLHNIDQERLLNHVQADPAWHVRYADEQSTYLVRR